MDVMEILEQLSEEGEQWAQLEGGLGRYWVSSNGRIFSTWGYRLLKPYRINKRKKYMAVKIGSCLEGGYQNKRIHRLVADAFLKDQKQRYLDQGLTKDDLDVHHKDGDVTNNKSDNLEWMSKKDHSKHHYGTPAVYV